MGAAAARTTTAAPSKRPSPPQKDNASVSRRPISSRYLSSSSSNSNSKRYPSPLLTAPPRPSSTPPRRSRSNSVGRIRPDPDPNPNPDPVPDPPSTTTARALTTRSLSVSFQGESFFYQTSKAPERRRTATPTRTPKPAPDHSENSRPFDRWPAAATHPRSIHFSSDKKEKPPILATVRLAVFHDGALRHASFDVGGDLSPSSDDTDSASSGSNSGTPETTTHLRPGPAPRGICVPARFWQETNNRLRRLPETGTPVPPSRTPAAPPKLGSVKKSLVESPVLSPHSVCPPIHGLSSPSKLVDARLRGLASPLRARSSALGNATPADQPGNAPSIISFAAEVRRAKKGENRIEEAHMLRLLHNRQSQWRFVNARVTAALVTQRLLVEKSLYNTWITISGMRDSVISKRIKLQLLTQNLKLTTLLKGQMSYLEEWSLMERDHSSSLLGSNEALKASTLRLPVVGGARADLQEVTDAVGSAVDVMQAMGSSICSLLPKAEGASSLVSELAKVAAQEQALLDQSRELLSKVTPMHVMQCSLRGHILQLKRGPNQMQL